MIKRAILAIVRRPAKTVIFFLTAFITLSLILAGFSTWQTVNRAISVLRLAFPAYIQVSGDGVDDTGTQQVLFGIDGVDEMITVRRQLFNAGELDVVPGLYTFGGDMERARDLSVIAISQSRYYSEFLYRLFILSEGRHIETWDEGVVIISGELARRNNISLGDVIVLSAATGDGSAGDSTADASLQSQAVLEVIGIFDCSLKQDVSIRTREFEIQENHLFTDNAAVQNIIADVQQTSVVLIVRDAAMLPEITQSIIALGGGLWNDKDIAVNNSAYEAVGQPLERMNSLIRILIPAVAAIGVLIMALTLLSWTRGRKWETGILLSLGLRRREIAGQYWLEAIFITLTAAFAACGIGGILIGSFHSAAVDLPKVGLYFSVTLLPCLYTLAVGIAIVTIAVALAAVPVMRAKPIKILSSEN